MTSSAAITDGDAVDITYPTKLTSNLLEKLKERKKQTGVPVTVQIRRAVERELGEPTVDESEDKSTAVPQNLEATLRSVLSDVLVHSVPVSVDRVRRGRLEALAQELGFAHVEDLLQDLAFRAIENPKNAASFLFSGIEESAIVAAQTDEHRSKTRKTTKTSKAA